MQIRRYTDGATRVWLFMILSLGATFVAAPGNIFYRQI